MTKNLQRRQRGLADWTRRRLGWLGAAGALSLVLGGFQAAAQPAPANDNFGSAYTISGASGSTNGTLAGATADANQPSYHAVGPRSVWYRWTAPIDGLVTFDTQRRSAEAVVTVYTGNAPASLTSAASPETPVSSCASFDADGGATYVIMVSGEVGGGFNGRLALTWAMPSAAGDVPSAGQFRFSSAFYDASEFETFTSGFGLDVPSSTLRSADGAVISVNRVNGSAGRVLVDYRTMDEVPRQLTATVVLSITNMVMSTNGMFFTNEALITRYFTNAYDRAGSLFFRDNFPTNFVTTTNICDMGAMETNCSFTNVVLNCAPDFLFRFPPTTRRSGSPTSRWRVTS